MVCVLHILLLLSNGACNYSKCLISVVISMSRNIYWYAADTNLSVGD